MHDGLSFSFTERIDSLVRSVILGHMNFFADGF
jgi:hypothetical protein